LQVTNILEGKMSEANSNDILNLTAEIVSAYVAKNPLPRSTLPEVIGQVHESLRTLASRGKAGPVAELVPAVPIKKSVTQDYIISLEDGRKFKSMKRYLGLLGMTPAEYRQKWGLAADYPIVAPNYAARRSQLAKKLGLGRKPAPEPARAKRKAAPRAK
jgi:predicted transcriptional regulator